MHRCYIRMINNSVDSQPKIYGTPIKLQTSLNQKIEKYRKWIVTFFFLLYLIGGCLIYKDYGIAVDDTAQKLLGEQCFDYIFHGDRYYCAVEQ